jgi:hypothetical protein
MEEEVQTARLEVGTKPLVVVPIETTKTIIEETYV